MTIDALKKKFDYEEKLITDYIDRWISFALIIRDCRRLQLNWYKKIKYLNNYLKFDEN